MIPFLARALALLCALGWPPFAAAQPLARPPALFQDLATPLKAVIVPESFVTSQRLVAIDRRALNGPRALLALPGAAPAQGLVAVWERVEPTSGGNHAWVGHVEGVELSAVVLAVDETAGIVMGSITMPGSPLYRIRYVEPGVHVVEAIDTRALPEELDIEEPPPAGPPTRKDEVAGDDGLIIDVMVVYTATARAAAGGTAAMNTLVDLAVAETNTAYASSGITQRLNLVYKGEVVYTESGSFSTDLSRLRATSDGYMDDVHTLRDTYHADLVSLIVNNTAACGIGYDMTNVSTAFESSGFTVVSRSCATGYFSYGHELGHTMGARHDWFVDPTNGSPYTYNHGYVAPSKAWRTILAYGDDCGGCTRIQRFSNPDLTFSGAATGVAEGSFHAADNRKALNATAATVANFRQSGVVTASCTYALAPLDASDTSAAGGPLDIVVTTPAGCAVTATTFQPWVTVSGIVPNGDTTTISLSIDVNVGPARATSIRVADRLFLITQLGGAG